MRIRLVGLLLLMSLGFLSLASMMVMSTIGLGRSEIREKRRTADIDVVLKDRNGYNYFLVFDTLGTVGKPDVRYEAEFWVNDFVILDANRVSALAFVSDSGSRSLPYEKSELVAGQNPAPTTVLYFSLDAATIRALAASHPREIQLSLKDGDLLVYTIENQESIGKAAAEALDRPTP